MKTRSIFSVAGLAVLLIGLMTTGALCGGSKLTPPTPVKLVIWRAEDNKNDFEVVTKKYTATYSYVTFEIKTFKKEEYEQALLDAWARGEGPDIFSVPNWRLGRFREFISPMPASVKLKTTTTKKTLGKTTVTVEQKTIPQLTAAQIQNQFIEAVSTDVIYDGKVYGLPYSIDTLALYYNRDILAKAQIAVPPTTWTEFVNAVQAITVLDDQKQIVLPAAGIGTTSNVPYSFDLLSLIMMQNGTTMVTQNGSVAFAQESETQPDVFPGTQALSFYTKFSDPAFKTYTWNDAQLNALESFTQGNLAMYFGYYDDLEVIQERAPNLHFSYAAVPQVDPDSPVHSARYSVESVHVTSKNTDHAWNFIRFAASEKEVKPFLESTKRIPAVRTLVGQKQTDPELGVFAQEALTAKTWYHGVDPDAAQQIFTDMINASIAKTTEPEEIIGLAAQKIRLTLKKQ